MVPNAQNAMHFKWPVDDLTSEQSGLKQILQ